MRVVVALGGNALLQRGQPMTTEQQRENVADRGGGARARRAGSHASSSRTATARRSACSPCRPRAYKEEEAYPLDVLGAATEGMIGYMLEQELGNRLPFEVPLATILTMVEVDADDPAFQNPTKFVGPIYDKAAADRLAAEKGWQFKQDGAVLAARRAVAAAGPDLRDPARSALLVEQGVVVVCAGGGGIPTMYDRDPRADARSASKRSSTRT